MKVRDAIKLIEADGWTLVRTRGSHRQYKHSTKPGLVTIPGRLSKDLPPGPQRSILKQSGFGREAMISVTEHGYLIVIERGDGNFGAWAPDLPGCVAVGDTIEECEREMREAVAFHLDGMREEGEPVPEPTAVAAAVVEVA